MAEHETFPLVPSDGLVLPHPAVLARINADRNRVARAWEDLQIQEADVAELWVMISHLASTDREVRQDIINAMMVARLAAETQDEISLLEAALNM